MKPIDWNRSATSLELAALFIAGGALGFAAVKLYRALFSRERLSAATLHSGEKNEVVAVLVFPKGRTPFPQNGGKA